MRARERGALCDCECSIDAAVCSRKRGSHLAAGRTARATAPAKRRKLGRGGNSTQLRGATRMNEVWSYDFVLDQTEDGRRLKWLPICDGFTRESVALEVERRMDAKDVVRGWIEAQGFRTLYIEPGRTPIASRSTGACELNCSTAKSSLCWRRQKCWAASIDAPTTNSDCIHRWIISLRRSSRGVALRQTPLSSVCRKATLPRQTKPNIEIKGTSG